MAARRAGIVLIWFAGGLAFVACGRPEPAPPHFTVCADSWGEVAMPAAARRADAWAKACDGAAATRWTTGAAVAPGFFVQISFPRERLVAAVTWDAGPAARDYPRAVRVETSRDGDAWEDTTAQARLELAGVSRVTFRPPRRARYIMITALKAEPQRWSIHEIVVVYADLED